MNLVESVMHKAALFLVTGILFAYGISLTLIKSEDPLWVGINIGVTLLVLYVVLYIIIKPFYYLGNKVNL